MSKAFSIQGWKDVMKEEMLALKQNETWDLVVLPSGKKAIEYRSVYIVKLNPDGSLAHLKARLVAKDYSQVYNMDYQDTISPVVKLTSMWILLSLAATHHWLLYKLDVKNDFLNVLDEEVYMEQPSDFVAQGKSGKVCRLKKPL